MRDSNILIICSKINIVKDIEKKLHNKGYYTCSIVRSWKGADKSIKVIIPDIIIIDNTMKSRFEDIKALMTLSLEKGIPVLCFTAYEDISDLTTSTRIYEYDVNQFQSINIVESIEKTLFEKSTCKRIKENEQWLFLLLENIGKPLISVDKNGCINYVNAYVEELLECDKSDILGQPFDDSISIINKDGQKISQLLLEDVLLRGLTVKDANHSLLLKNKTEKVSIIYNFASIKNFNKIVGAIFVLRVEETDGENCKISDDMQKFIDTITKLLEFKDSYTAGHQKRVATLAKIIGQKMKLDIDKQNLLFFGGLLHDLGKIGIPIDILNKTTKLTDPEFNLIKQHPEIGYNILKDLMLPEEVLDMMLHHHEKLDGSGYPNGIKGDAISIYSRIITICDVIEAMSTFRPYRPAKTKMDVINELTNGKINKYDEDIIDIAIDLIQSEEIDPWKIS